MRDVCLLFIVIVLCGIGIELSRIFGVLTEILSKI